MENTVEIEVIGFSDSSCGPFPCDEERTCELENCAPTESLMAAFDALEERLHDLYGERIILTLTLIDDGVPDYVKEIVETHHPPIPIILVNGHVTPVGRISVPLIMKEIEKYMNH